MARSKEQQRQYMREYRARKRAERAAAAAADAPPAPPASATPDPPATRKPRHVAAVDRMLQETGLGTSLEDAPLVELLRELAAELDLEANARTRQQYLMALRDARRVLAAAPGVPGAGGKDEEEPVTPADPAPEEPAVEPGVADFASFKRAKGGAAAR